MLTMDLTPATEALERSRWDAIVVGAGPAGSMAARELAVRGAQVLLVDRRVFPRDKVCGGCLNGQALAGLRAAGLGGLVERSGGVPLRSFRLGMRGRTVELPLPSGMAVSRDRFDTGLAAAGGGGRCAVLARDGRRDRTGRRHLPRGAARGRPRSPAHRGECRPGGHGPRRSSAARRVRPPSVGRSRHEDRRRLPPGGWPARLRRRHHPHGGGPGRLHRARPPGRRPPGRGGCHAFRGVPRCRRPGPRRVGDPRGGRTAGRARSCDRPMAGHARPDEATPPARRRARCSSWGTRPDTSSRSPAKGSPGRSPRPGRSRPLPRGPP